MENLYLLMKVKGINSGNHTIFDRFMRGLIGVPKDELDAEIRKEQREKAKKPKDPRRKK